MIAGIYAILDVGERRSIEDNERILEQLLTAGVGWFQLRAKTLPGGPMLALARRLVERCHRSGARLLVNDRPDVAVLAGADGVHLGQQDLPAGAVKRWLPAAMIVGVSCHSSDQLAAQQLTVGADYLAVGPIFPTRSKANPDPVVGLAGLAAACAQVAPIAVVAIGGITVERLPEIRAAGAASAAMIADLLDAPDIEARARQAVAAWPR